MIEICALASGSNGNSYYVGNHEDAILVDAGISTKQLLLRMKSRNLDPRRIKAVFLSHEHSDHSSGIRVLSKRLCVNVYMSKHTYYSLPKSSRPENIRFFEPGQGITVSSFNVYTFLKNHDAVEPCSFRIEGDGFSTGVFTDIGAPCDRVKQELNRCQAVFMETNYDEKMLREGPYPWYLKQRIASDKGHLSNLQAIELVESHRHPRLECIFLSHISQENNTPGTAMSAFEPLSDTMQVKLTSRHEASEVYRAESSGTEEHRIEWSLPWG